MTAKNVVALCPKVTVEQNAEPIASLYKSLGTASAEQVVTRALGEVAMAMASIASQVQACELKDLSRQLRKLQAMADNLGMISLAKVSGDARVCLERGDSTAFSAVWARLILITEKTLSPDQDIMDRTSS